MRSNGNEINRGRLSPQELNKFGNGARLLGYITIVILAVNIDPAARKDCTTHKADFVCARLQP